MPLYFCVRNDRYLYFWYIRDETHMKNELLIPEYDLWNRFVDQSPQGDVFCYTWWLDTVTKNDFKILVVKKNNKIVAGIILPFFESGRINEPYLTRTVGVLYKERGKESARKRLSMERRWLNTLLDQVDINNVVQMCMHHNFTDWLPFRWRGYKQTTRYTYIIDYLKTPVEKIQQDLSKGQKWYILKAIQNGLEVKEGNDIAVAYNHSCLSFNRQSKKFPYSLTEVKILDEAVKKHGMRKIFHVIDKQGNIHAANYIVYNKKSAYHLLSGGDVQYRALGGHTLLLWHTIEYFSDKVPIFNFGGSDIQSIEKHIRGFGGSQTQYFHIYNETLLFNHKGLKYHCSRLLYHGSGALKDLQNRPLRRFPFLLCMLVKVLYKNIKKVLYSKHYA